MSVSSSLAALFQRFHEETGHNLTGIVLPEPVFDEFMSEMGDLCTFSCDGDAVSAGAVEYLGVKIRWSP